MLNHNKSAMPQAGRSFTSRLLSGGFAALSLAMLLAASNAQAVAPAVGSLISNQASATYTDGSGANKTATSNNVVTTVTQVASLTLTPDNTKTVAPGGTAYTPHVLTNTGNGTDTYTLALVDKADGTFTFGSMEIYADADGNGVPDSATPLCTSPCASFTTPAVPAGGVYKFVEALKVPITALNAQIDHATVTATSVTDGTQKVVNTDTVNVTTGPAFNVTKGIDKPNGFSAPAACGSTKLWSDAACSAYVVTYTLTYANTGSTGNLYLKDLIGSGTTIGMQYVPGSAKWSASGTSLTDVASGDPTGIDFQAITAAPVTTIETVIANVGANTQGTVTFQVGILSTAALGNSTTTNTANYAVPAGTTVATIGTITTNPTNPASYVVAQKYSVITDSVAAAGADGDNTNPTGNDVAIVASAAPGTTVVFNDVIWNTGTGTDNFNITLDTTTVVPTTSKFPAGTTFQLYKTDGATGLGDSNGDGTPDTGSLPAGGSYTIVVKAILPAGACNPTCPTGPFAITEKATSIGDVTANNVMFDQLTALTQPTVDIANSAGAAGAGNKDAVSGTPTTKTPITAGNTAVFDLYVGNDGATVDNYNLAYSNSNFSANVIPVGWTVAFRSTTGTCSTTSGNVITNTGNILAGQETHLCAVVTSPNTAPAGDYPVYFQVTSGATGATDVKYDAVTINANAAMTLTPNGSGQVYPGGSIVYPHTLTNTGNTVCGGGFTFTVNSPQTGWSVAVYADSGSVPGAIDGTDQLLSSNAGSVADLAGPVAIGANVKLLAKVIAPAGASSGDTDNVTISVVDHGTVACTVSPANDATLVITGELRLDKVQANDADCNGIADAAFVSTPLSAKPGECLVYKITANNAGTTNVTAITINDNTPSFTTYFDVAGAKPLTCTNNGGGTAPTVTAPTAGSTGALSCGVYSTIIPSALETMQFVVKVNQ